MFSQRMTRCKLRFGASVLAGVCRHAEGGGITWLLKEEAPFYALELLPVGILPTSGIASRHLTLLPPLPCETQKSRSTIPV